MTNTVILMYYLFIYRKLYIMKQKILFVLWFFRTPIYLPEFFLILTNRIRNGIVWNKRKEKVIARCEEHALTTQEALQKIMGDDFVYTPIIETYVEEFAQWDLAVEACPVRMWGRGDIDLLYYLTEHIQAKNVIETGVAYWWSSLSILLSLQHRSGKLYSIDMPYPLLDNKEYVGCAVPTKFAHLHTLEQTCDRIALSKQVKTWNTYDLCHYDSDKTYYGRMKNYKRLWNMIRQWWIFISDDIADNDAFYDFCIYLKVEPIIVWFEWKFIGVILK